MSSELNLPGFRFHPTEEELLDFYLKNTLLGKKLHNNIIGTTNIYRHDPWDLPSLANIGEREWYFLVPRDRKQGATGGRPTRTTENGFWKATGTDRRILNSSEPNKRVIGLRKTLVFYRGRAPRGCKTDWIMNEYRHPDSSSLPKDMVICKIYRKATSMKVLEQRAATSNTVPPACPSSLVSTACTDAHLFCSVKAEDFVQPASSSHGHQMDKEEQCIHESMVAENVDVDGKSTENKSFSSPHMSRKLQLPAGSEKVLDLQMPIDNKFTMDWTQESPWTWTQLGSPWFFNLTPTASILNF